MRFFASVLASAPSCAGAFLVLTSALVLACGDDSPSLTGGAATGGADAGGAASNGGSDPAGGGGGGSVEDIYDPERIVEVEIEMSPADANALANQTRNLLAMLAGEGCMDQPFASPYTFFPATVRVDGVERSNVGVRKKGFVGSLSVDKPSLKIDFAELEPGQTLDGIERLTLNNSNQDPSLIKTCLTYYMFTAAGLPAPRCNFAHVRFNGEDLGIYANVEPINADFVKAHFDDASGNLYEGTLSDFRNGFDRTFEKETNTDDGSQDDIGALTAALTSDDGSLLASIEPLVDVDEYLTHLAMEVLTNHWDGYSNNNNNFYVYNDPSAGFRFIVSGPDGALQANNPFEAGPSAPKSIFATATLPRRLYLLPAGQALYLAKLQEVLDGAWNEDAFIAEADRMQALIQPIAGPGIAGEADLIRSFIAGRRAVVTAELEPTPPAWPYPLREPLCLDILGDVESTFETSFGSLGQNPFVQGPTSFEVTLGGTSLALDPTGTLAGFDTNSPPGAVVAIQIVGQRTDGLLEGLVLSLDANAVTAGSEVVLDVFGNSGTLITFNPTTMAITIEGLVSGTVSFDEAALTAGETITGSVSGTVLEPFGP